MIAQLPFSSGLQSGIDELAGSNPIRVNTTVDQGNVVRARPGIAAWSDFPAPPSSSPVMGLGTYGDYLVYVDYDRRIWAVKSPGYVVPLSDPTDPTTFLDGAERPVFAEFQSKVVITGGGVPQKWDGASPLSARLGGEPPVATHVIGLTTHVVVNHYGLDGQIEWSDPGEEPGSESWPGNIATAEANPDPVLAIVGNGNEFLALGSRTIQLFSPDPTVDFSPGRALNVGVCGRYGAVQVDDVYAIMDHNRHAQLTDGRSLQVVSDPAIQATLEKLSFVSDVWGFRWHDGASDCVVWVFPTEGRAFTYENGAKKWGEWKSWSGSGFIPLAVNCHLHWPERNLDLVGLNDGTIGKLDLTSATDRGEPIRLVMRTGFNDNGTPHTKLCRRLKFVFRRGIGVFGSPRAPVVELRWRDNLGAMSQPKMLSLGNADEIEPVIEIFPCSTYIKRQWEISTDASMVLVSATEEFDDLGV